MPPSRPPCPFLPEAPERMNYRSLSAHGERRDAAFYLSALSYGQFLWQSGRSARAILAITRGLYSEVSDRDSILTQFPLPYKAIGWIVRNHPGDSFLGNPRVSFQHQADRVRGARRPLLSTRAWAAWWVVRVADPLLMGDPNHIVREPSPDEIVLGLERYGITSERLTWDRAVSEFIQTPLD